MTFLRLEKDEEIDSLQETVAMLNDWRGREDDWKGKRYGADDAVKLRRLVHAWKDAVVESEKNGVAIVPGMKLLARDRADLERFMQNIHARVNFDGAWIVSDRVSPWDEAARQFLRLLNNRQRDRLKGPCRGVKNKVVCGRWFVSKTYRLAIFCGRQCAGSASQAYKRDRERQKKLSRAKEALENYPARPKRFKKLSWKDYVHEDTGISKKFLQTAFLGGQLNPPA